jgi:hypothetical protein
MGKRKSGVRRLKNGRIANPTTRSERKALAHDYGNERVQERLERFRDKRILNGKAAWIDIFDGIGQLHAIGMLDGHGIDGKLMRDAGREYIGLYNYTFIDLLPKGSDLERAYGGRSSSGKSDLIPPATSRELRFERMDALLPMRSQEREWTHKLLLDHFGLDTVHPLVTRLVNFRFAQWKLPVAGQVAGADDFQLLGCILRGLFALADGSMPDRWRIAA